MPTPDEVRSMKDILAKMALIESGKDSSISDQDTTDNQTTPNVSVESREMWNILNRLKNATNNANQMLTEEAKQGSDSIIVRKDTKQSSKFNVGGYSIILEKKKLSNIYTKTYYTIVKGNVREYENLALFETAMAITKQLLFTPDEVKLQTLVDLDRLYDRYLNEAAEHKAHLYRIDEGNNSGVQYDVQNAKRSSVISKMKKIKNQIKTIL
jgi:hypothetical protein